MFVWPAKSGSACICGAWESVPLISAAIYSDGVIIIFLGSGQTDFGPQLKSMNKQFFTVIAWDPRGYGKSIPPDRDFPPDFFERDAKDAVDLMQVNLFYLPSNWSFEILRTGYLLFLLKFLDIC